MNSPAYDEGPLRPLKIDRSQAYLLQHKILVLGAGFRKAEILTACMNVIGHIIMEGDPSPEEAATAAVNVGSDIAAGLDRYFKNLGPKP